MMTFITTKYQEYKTVGLGMIMILVIGGAFALLQTGAKPTQPTFPDMTVIAQETPTMTNLEEQDTPATIVVDIKGAVHKEGVYELASDKRVHDLIDMAGGFLPDADPKSVNLAQRLSDEAVIYVARQGEESLTPSIAPLMSNQTDKISLNKASVAELQTITGIGAKKAQDIVTFREQNGGFKTLDDLKQVTGIGEKTFDKIQGELRLD